ncbi:IS3 family transposase, partial [Chitinimonas sp. PSY-7]|uniref:IS3 family transposase n=1 Tax=Chitinimonas sp. PSY-7 TaxID=3459088 RepID=UPI004040337E
SRRAQEDERLRVAIRAAHDKTRGTYSARRLQTELAAEGIVAGQDRIARLRREEGICCVQQRQFKTTTHSAHCLPVAIKDVFTCEIVGYAMSARMTQDLVSQALWKAIKWKRPEAGLMLHSDRGSQYCSQGYRAL